MVGSSRQRCGKEPMTAMEQLANFGFNPQEEDDVCDMPIPKRTYPMMSGEYKTVKQTESADCGAAVAAMLVDLPLTDVKRAMIATKCYEKGTEYRYYKTCEMARYLACHNMLMGIYGTSAEPNKTLQLDRHDYIEFKWELREVPAVLCVRSENYADHDHWVLWDGRYVRDPNPEVPDLRELNEFEIVDVYPLVYVKEG